ncbi:MAG: TRAP transporter large permease subunit [Mailhella sp.]|nr:TRAP transporter large permease subunit [Mailhella sp.]
MTQQNETIAAPIEEKNWPLKNDGALEPLCFLESWYNILVSKLLLIAAVIAGLLLIPVSLDVILRPVNGGLHFLMDIESMSLVVLAFIAMGYCTATKTQINIDLVYKLFSPGVRGAFDVFANSFGLFATIMMTRFIWRAALTATTYTGVLRMDHKYFIAICAFGFGVLALGLFIQLCHALKERLKDRDVLGILIPIAVTVFLYCLPYLYKHVFGIKLSSLAIGALGMLFLFILFLCHVPIGIAMMGVSYIGMMTIMRTINAVSSSIGPVPFRNASDFVYLAMPMFMLMGEIMTMGGLSDKLFNCMEKWLGRVPGGLACATVAGCAGFGAVCGESLPTVITMTNVALKPMKDMHYDLGLACGSLAAGGTLGILIPPSMGFIFYSIMTEESVGKLFAAGIIPGILLASIFILIIWARCKRNPDLAPPSRSYPFSAKMRSTLGLIPVAILFIIVVIGILQGFFTPGEGGAVGTVCGLVYCVGTGNFRLHKVLATIRRTAALSARLFCVMAGVFIFGVFLSSSRLPSLLADFVLGLNVSRYFILGIVILIYILLGFVMNIIPMMMFTLPSIYPTIQALGFDGIWFGVVTVIVMEMGLITPPVGMNVFTMASLVPEIPMGTIFKGVMPFFVGMCLCVLILILFPQLALFLVS